MADHAPVPQPRDAPPAPRVAAVVPTFNHGGTVANVLREVGAHGLTVICVDDGSTDATDATLATWFADGEDRHVVTHPHNRGKAAALRSGFERAEALGFAHALTIDADGQHDAGDIPALLAAAARQPHALILGERDAVIAGCPRSSIVGRRLSNLLVRIESGLTVRDSQCGLRVYPISLTRRLAGWSNRYGFETAILTRFAWARLPVVGVPVRCVYEVPGGRISHFRPTRDSIAAGFMHLALLHRALLPGPRVPEREAVAETQTGTLIDRVGRWLNPLRTWRHLKASRLARKRFAASIGVGVFIAHIPVYGIKTCVCLGVARWLRLEPIGVLGTSSVISAPPIGPVLAVASIGLGSVLLGGGVPSVAAYDPRTRGAWTVLGEVAAEWFLGGAILGAAFGLLTYAAAKFMLARRPSKPATTAAPAA